MNYGGVCLVACPVLGTPQLHYINRFELDIFETPTGPPDPRSPKTPQHSDILFPCRSPSHRPHPTPPKWTRNGPGTDPKRSQTEPNGAERSQTEPKWTEIKPSRVGRPGGFVGMGRGGGCKGKGISLPQHQESAKGAGGKGARVINCHNFFFALDRETRRIDHTTEGTAERKMRQFATPAPFTPAPFRPF